MKEGSDRTVPSDEFLIKICKPEEFLDLFPSLWTAPETGAGARLLQP